MTHLIDSDTPTKARTPNEWLPVGSAIGTLINQWAGMRGLVAFVGPKCGGSTAFYQPLTYEIEVNSDVAFGKEISPEIVGDLTLRSRHYEFPKAVGAIYHEAMHAKFTTWDLRHAARDLTPGQNAALHDLEEGRIEALGVLHDTNQRVFLRACALHIVMAGLTDEEIKKQSTTRRAAKLAALCLARVDAGVLQESDVARVRAIIGPLLGDDLLADLRSIWQRFQGIRDADRNTTRMYNLAIEWDKLVEEAATERGEPTPQEERDSADGGGDIIEIFMDEEQWQEMMDALEGDASRTIIRAQGEAYDQETAERYAEQVKQKSEEAEEKKRADEVAEKVFKKVGFAPNSREMGQKDSNSKLISSRPPTDDEHRAAVTVAKEWERAKYRDRLKTKSMSAEPPGRLRSRAVLQGEAMKAAGVEAVIEPWRRTMSKKVEDPNLTVGMMVDISGSMGRAMAPMASASFVVSEAVRRIQGTAATVYFGNDVFPTLRPGERLHEVKTYSANDGVERFNKGFQALNGSLGLLNGRGARLLVIVSDGNYGGSGEAEAVRKWLRRCKETGVAVLWVGYGSSKSAENYSAAAGAEFVLPGGGIVADALLIGQAGARALTAASR